MTVGRLVIGNGTLGVGVWKRIGRIGRITLWWKLG